MPLTTSLPRAADTFAALPQSDWIDAVNDVTTAQRIAIPEGAKFVLFGASAAFYAKFGTAAVTATVVSGAVADGSGSIYSPTFRKIADGQTHISVVAAASVDITLEYFKGVGE